MTRLILGFAVTYLIISLPDIFGLTFAIQWVPGVSPVQKAWTYFTSGLAENALGKLVVATLSALLFRFCSRLFRGLA
ncbi:hypothetical protein [Brevibacillus panacihumi]|uniref:Uncharacterized protein n=1 Tax=Brevibacillus panacihumi TaxID=497735 RepID=A0A3M8CZC2_9BACL|nr:hypothetical protein [Brevibacillus panacihumi]RNB80789.1 hypothetical protein EDM58_08065 [Brevibacillus panacihumi]